jgi:D-alanine-D-alanine ligase
MASLGRTGSYVHAASVAGYDYKALVNRMLDVAVVRYFASRVVTAESPGEIKKVPAHIRIRGFLRSRQESHEKLLQKAVNINTHVRNVEGVNELGNLIRREMGLLNFSHEVIPQVEVGNLLFFTNSYSGDYDILLLGNMDNRIRIADHVYFSTQDQKMSGTGIWEHKGGIVACLAALQSLRFLRILRKIKIGILLTTDDSLQGKFAREIVREKSRRASYVLGLHGGDLSGSLITSRSGSAFYTVNMHLKKSDDSNMVSVAASVFSKLINSWCELSLDDQSLVIAPYKTSLNTNIMQPYAHGEVQLSVRYNHKEQFGKVEEKLKKLIPRSKFKDSIHFQMDGGMSRDPLVENEQSKEFFRRVLNLSRNLDVRITREHRWSSADICFVDPALPILDGFGPIGQKLQDRSEFILRHSLLERALLIAITLKEISRV